MKSISQATAQQQPDPLQSLLDTSYQLLLDRLQDLQTPDGHWTGKLSTSALSTATAISALSLCRQESDRWSSLIDRGIDWLAKHQNRDGGFGDTDRSHSNIATTYLVIAAVHLAKKQNELATLIQRARSYVERLGGWDGLRRRYGKDKTFVVPILTNCALAGLVDWKQVPVLPFEAAALPQSWYRFAKMPVVSYAIPALVAIGQVRHHFAPTRNPIARIVRNLAKQQTLEVLHRMQPESGGYLEAVPLTSFVLMSLAAMKKDSLPVARQCIRFLEDSVLPDGSWPIDTNLATWVTSLAVRAIEVEPSSMPESQPKLVREETIRWLIGCQHRKRHPFTGADPGGWGWTDLSGAVPDADDTPAALLALWQWRSSRNSVSTSLDREIEVAVRLAIPWLLGLQNRDGGWPTFCRGWGQLPFDRSGNDLTAHAIRALVKWNDQPLLDATQSESISGAPQKRIRRAVERGLTYLKKGQADDGSWLPLWFGNQDDPNEDNPIYGTSRVLMALSEVRTNSSWKHLSCEDMIQRGVQFLLARQNDDGGWGGGPSVLYDRELLPSEIVDSPALPRADDEIRGDSNFRNSKVPNIGSSSVEESAVALEALLACSVQTEFDKSIMRGLRFLGDSVQKGWTETSWPIGFYFAKLWYHEQMYPIVFSLAAFQLARKRWHEYR